MTPTRRERARGALASCALAACAALAAPGTAAAQANVSANWAGYVAFPSAGVGERFSGVSGSWRQPAGRCAVGRETYSATWVGLGGYSEGAQALEQVGTDADCTRAGGAVYSSWYELLPAPPVDLKLTVHPGDEMVASVTVAGHDVTLRIRDLSSGERFSVTAHARAVDVSSAEWIVEAPSACASSESCEVLPLTDFGEVPFAAATATAAAHTGTIADPEWSSTALELRQRAAHRASGRPRSHIARTLTVAAPSPSAAANGAFSVSWQEQTMQGGQPSAPTLPGFGGGAP